ncbi:hypothetical protein BLOT_015344 [Blomia tropicalis]|nr:hypothetical protein BLOT_015344 [Blomia tropicalis]
MDLAADHWYDTLEHGLGRRSLVQHSETWTWQPIIGTTLWNMDLAADHWYNTLEYGLGRRSLVRHSGIWTWPPIIGTTADGRIKIDIIENNIKIRLDIRRFYPNHFFARDGIPSYAFYYFFAEAVMLNIYPDVDVLV